jgi:hypothetical protein
MLKKLFRFVLTIVVLYLVLLIPDKANKPLVQSEANAFFGIGIVFGKPWKSSLPLQKIMIPI